MTRVEWLDGLGRAAAVTEDSYRLWRSRLTPDDLDDPAVVGFSRWFENEVAARHGRLNRHTPLGQ